MKYQEIEMKMNPLYQRRLSIGKQTALSQYI